MVTLSVIDSAALVRKKTDAPFADRRCVPEPSSAAMTAPPDDQGYCRPVPEAATVVVRTVRVVPVATAALCGVGCCVMARALHAPLETPSKRLETVIDPGRRWPVSRS